MEKFDEKFLPLISTFDRDHLRENSASLFGFWPDLRLAYLNEAWWTFAAENGGEPAISTSWTIGARLTDAISHPLDEYYARRLAQCLAEGQPWNHEYECSSPERYRKFHMIVYPLKDGQGGLVVNSLVVERPHDSTLTETHSVQLKRYTDAHNSLHQCMHCRRTRRQEEGEHWDWVRAWVAQSPPNTSHGLCQACLDFYYPDLEEEIAATV